MAIYIIGDLHLSLNHPKPMDIFGDNWENHTNKINENWIKTVKCDDTVIQNLILNLLIIFLVKNFY